MIKTCRNCGEEFTPVKSHPHQQFCSRKCREEARNDGENLRAWFKTEWAAWQRDFAAGKTQSNFKR